ncbi:MAG: hypothetical protein WD052_11925, partial [Bacteroidales bacterium]
FDEGATECFLRFVLYSTGKKKSLTVLDVHACNIENSTWVEGCCTRVIFQYDVMSRRDIIIIATGFNPWLSDSKQDKPQRGAVYS